jgi:hypothetical protein
VRPEDLDPAQGTKKPQEIGASEASAGGLWDLFWDQVNGSSAV